VKIENLVRFCVAAHYTFRVDSPYRQRGGIFLVSGPGSMKSSIVKTVVESVTHTLGYSDLTLKQLAVIRNQIASGTYHTLGFYELEKLYARQGPVSSNLEGVIKAMVEEGFAHFAFEDQRIWVPNARCFVIGSVLQNLYEQKSGAWNDNGFSRRFIWIKYLLSQKMQEAKRKAREENRLIPMPEAITFAPSTMMPMDVSKEENSHLEQIIDAEAGDTPINLLRKTLTVLKWYHRKANGKARKQHTPMEIINDLRGAIRPRGNAELEP
jgi:hypothetical protein